MKNALIVDDTKNIRNLLATCLEIEGYHVVSALDGMKALACIQAERFDLIFLDIKLPELSGTEVLRRIRELGISTPVIIMTAFATIKNAVECTKLGAVAYLQKPFTADKIRHVLSEVMESQEDMPVLLKKVKELMLINKMDDAFRSLKKALALDPNCGEIYYLLAKVYQTQKNKEEAERFFKIATQFNFNREEENANEPK